MLWPDTEDEEPMCWSEEPCHGETTTGCYKGLGFKGLLQGLRGLGFRDQGQKFRVQGYSKGSINQGLPDQRGSYPGPFSLKGYIEAYLQRVPTRIPIQGYYLGVRFGVQGRFRPRV